MAPPFLIGLSYPIPPYVTVPPYKFTGLRCSCRRKVLLLVGSPRGFVDLVECLGGTPLSFVREFLSPPYVVRFGLGIEHRRYRLDSGTSLYGLIGGNYVLYPLLVCGSVVYRLVPRGRRLHLGRRRFVGNSSNSGP